MKLLEKFRAFVARRALQRKMLDEVASMSDAELLDLNLSYARITQMARQQAAALAR